MEEHSKLPIYKGIIQYILDSTGYTLKNIAEFSNASVTSIRSIHRNGLPPSNFKSELQLVKLYQIILEINMDKNNQPRTFVNK